MNRGRKLRPTAAMAVAPRRPTMAMSTIWVSVCSAISAITGQARASTTRYMDWGRGRAMAPLAKLKASCQPR